MAWKKTLWGSRWLINFYGKSGGRSTSLGSGGSSIWVSGIQGSGPVARSCSAQYHVVYAFLRLCGLRCSLFCPSENYLNYLIHLNKFLLSSTTEWTCCLQWDSYTHNYTIRSIWIRVALELWFNMGRLYFLAFSPINRTCLSIIQKTVLLSNQVLLLLHSHLFQVSFGHFKGMVFMPFLWWKRGYRKKE